MSAEGGFMKKFFARKEPAVTAEKGAEISEELKAARPVAEQVIAEVNASLTASPAENPFNKDGASHLDLDPEKIKKLVAERAEVQGVSGDTVMKWINLDGGYPLSEMRYDTVRLSLKNLQ
jgi:hypothetical protein